VSNSIEVHERPILFDRIQCHVTPDYVDTDNEEFKKFTDPAIATRKLYGYKHRYFVDKKGNSHYVVELPDDPERPYIKNIRVDVYHPFTVSFKLNFIRLLRYKLKDDPNFRKDYDKYVLLDEDNYINYEVWPYWNNNLVSDVLSNLSNLCVEIANQSMCMLLPYHYIPYENVTVIQLETNIDFYVGCNNSLYVSKQYLKFIVSDEGDEFRKNLCSIALKCHVPVSDFDDDMDAKEKNSCHSVGFQISKDLYFKIYRKDKDHVRAELMFNKGYLQRKFKRKYIDNYGNVKVSSSRNINKISRPVLEFSKSFFKKIDLPSVFHSVTSGNSHFVVLNQMNDLHDFYLRVNPEMISVIDSVLNHVPLVKHDAIMFLRKHPNMRRQFVRVYGGNGNWFYNWDPVKAEYLRNDMIKNRYAKPRVPNVTIPNYMG